MYDFYDRLMKGESAEDIAKSITDELNKAQKKKEEAEKVKFFDKTLDSLEKTKDKTNKSVDDLIDDFLTKMGW